MGVQLPDVKERVKFLIDLGCALHRYGASSPRIERHLTNTASMLGMNGSFLVTPTSVTFAFWTTDPHEQLQHLARLEPGGMDLGKLWQLDEIVESMAAERMSFLEGRNALDALHKARSTYPSVMHGLAWCITGAAFTTLLGGSSVDLIAASGISLLTFGISLLAGASSRFASLASILAAFVAGACAQVLLASGFAVHVSIVVVASILVMIPGLSLTVAMSEIAARHLVSGSSRLMDAFMNLAFLAFGALVGSGIVQVLMPAQGGGVESIAFSQQWPMAEWFAVFFLSVSLMVGFSIPLRKGLWGMLCCYVAYFISQTAGAYWGTTAAMFFGALGVGIYSNSVARIFKVPSTVLATQGIILLVPGSRTYALLRDWASGADGISGADQAAQSLMMFLSLIAGLLFANAILPPRKSL